MQITVVSISKPEWKNKGKAKWQEVTLTYTSDQGEKNKKFLSFNDIYKEITSLEVGSTYEVRLEKDGDFWQWVGIEKVEGTAKATSTGGGSSGNSWVDRTALDRERFEFEKEKQILIIRQSMIAAAVEIAAQQGTNHVENIIAIAEELVDYVLTGPTEVQAESEQEPDID